MDFKARVGTPPCEEAGPCVCVQDVILQLCLSLMEEGSSCLCAAGVHAGFTGL